jgi:hypothetical protein
VIASVTAALHDDVPSVEVCFAELLDQLGIAKAHFAGRGSADLKGTSIAVVRRTKSKKRRAA